MPTITDIETTILGVLEALGCWAMLQSAGRQALPDTICYPACFVLWDGDEGAATTPRPIDQVSFKVIVQTQNMAGEALAALDAYALNDLVRDAIRGKTLGLANIDPFACVSRQNTDYDDSDGMIEYTHIYRAKQYQPIVTE